ncbi:MAG: phosphoesterase PA-phosphatase, partial [Bacteroidetes bacterium]|nr:phosphoesterase PA-phosphatase [Bacteroidota bacterium]
MKYLLALATGSALCMASCHDGKDYTKITHDPDLYAKTVHQLNTVIMGNNFSPIVSSRNYVYANVAAYEIIAAAHPNEYNSLAGQLKGLPAVPKPDSTKKDFEFAALLAFCKLGEAVTFPAGSMKEYVDSLKELVLNNGMPQEVLANTVAYSDTVSSVIMAWSKKDNYAQSRSFPKYNVIDSPGRWVPTPPAYTSAMEPHWNEIRTLVMDSCSQFAPPAPYKFDMTDKKSDYYQQVVSIKNAIDSLTPEQKHIADFWDDNPFKLNVSGHVMFGTKKFSPPGHWMSIVGIAAKTAHADYATTVRAYAITSIALF